MTTTEVSAVNGAELAPIAELCDGEVSFRTDGGRNFVYMEGLHFFANGVEKKMDALLCLNHNNPSYPTKLYLAEQLGAGLNWNETAYILGRHWHTFSWSGVGSDQSVFAILAAHLRPLNPGKAA
jgi:hypothetical protein